MESASPAQSCPPHGGAPIGSEQATVAVHRGSPIDLEWRDPGGERRRSLPVTRGLVHINASRRPLWQRWLEPADILVIALDQQTLARAADELPVLTTDIRTDIAADDGVIRHLGELYEKELLSVGLGGRLYLDSLNTALSIHLLRHYAMPLRPIPDARGGLSPTRLRRVTSYMNDHLRDRIDINDLSAVTGLTTHHFAAAFKTSVGETPHRHLVRLRVTRARELVMSSPMPIAEIATEVGFANQSHLTHHFRHIFGITPARLRRER